MPLILLIVVLATLKFFTIGPFGDFSWWWIAGLMGVAFIWFEFVERAMGLDKLRAHAKMDKIKQDRIKKSLEANQRPRRK
ncbi:TIGR04438 family Trp-rich protein [Glaciimonas immobilis]|uniref:Small Trp-rich protein n=1 Tax=Glaciimonas immobilis TaxID=728004 RepID=A0A840RSU7_9BURK|nr:TIGR04438 family Trp-rich protein [Glaciimonas immobilis]KAF3997584.1 TIGR04438 family Trp-rich protein [Glaciimonas immobilis]MBB5200723.1 small Trp-rich protein [Glaciimonas immobilis]